MKLNNKINITIVLVCIILGCNNSSMNNTQKNEGTLRLYINNSGVNGRTITPNVSTEIYTYDLNGIGPEGETFETLNVIGDLTFEVNLLPGDWKITVYGKNIDEVLIASVIKDVYISSEIVTNEEIHLSPITGSGKISYKLSWDELSISSTIVNAKLINQSSNKVVNVEVVISDDNNSLLIERQLESGYYTLSIQLFDGETLIWGNIDSVRILANQLTSYDGKVE